MTRQVVCPHKPDLIPQPGDRSFGPEDFSAAWRPHHYVKAMAELAATLRHLSLDGTLTPEFNIVLDCGFGWPSAKRPRRERIGAVAKQVSNFVVSAEQCRRAAATSSRATRAPPTTPTAR